jgi:hypothetical protein
MVQWPIRRRSIERVPLLIKGIVHDCYDDQLGNRVYCGFSMVLWAFSFLSIARWYAFFWRSGIGRDEGLRYRDYSNSCNESDDTDTAPHERDRRVFSFHARGSILRYCSPAGLAAGQKSCARLVALGKTVFRERCSMRVMVSERTVTAVFVFDFSVAHRMVIPRLAATVDSGKLCLRTIQFFGNGNRLVCHKEAACAVHCCWYFT